MKNELRFSFLLLLTIGCAVLQAGPLIFVARRQIIERKTTRISEREVRLTKFLQNPSSKERSKMQFELMNKIKQKIKVVSERMYDIGLNEHWQKDHWMECAERSRHEGYEVLASQYENFAKYELGDRQNDAHAQISDKEIR